MNKLKKIGLTALGTSLVASSAIAADASLTGNAGYTWSSEEVGTSTTDGIGYEADFNMAISGELDNGWSVTGSMLITESNTLSSSWTQLTMGSLGSVLVGNGYGGVGQAFDDVTPKAYEENHDGMKTTTAIDSVGAHMGNSSIMYTSPTLDVMGASVSVMGGYAPEASGAAVTDGGVSTSSNLWSSGKDLGIKIAYAGATLGAYGSELQKDSSDTVTENDQMSATWHASYTAGPVSIGYQSGGYDNGLETSSAASTAAATVAASAGTFEFEKMSVAFNVNENLSVSYGELTETYNPTADEITNVDMDSKSIQFAYTMGSMKLSGYQTDTDNPGWDSDAKSDEVTELALNFSF